MSKQSEREALAALLATSTVEVRKLPSAPLPDPSIPQTQKAPKTKRPRIKRNWAAQRRYDEEHGTVNGYDPYIEEMLALRRREQ
jgi:hypothetical protein